MLDQNVENLYLNWLICNMFKIATCLVALKVKVKPAFKHCYQNKEEIGSVWFVKIVSIILQVFESWKYNL